MLVKSSGAVFQFTVDQFHLCSVYTQIPDLFFFFLSPFYCASMYSVEKTPNADAWHYPSDDHVLGEAAITEHYG